MAAIDFPAAPALNQLFAAPNGSSYQWNGVVWVPVGVGGSVIAIGDTPPSSPSPGQQWFNTVLGATFIWYDDSTSAQWVPTNPVPMTTPPGAVMAGAGSNVQGNGVTTVIIFPTVQTGNNGTWLNVANGRYTPPIGRYFLHCNLSNQAPVGGNGTWTLGMRKNGGTNFVSINGSGAAQFAIPLSVGAAVDASGTDYFECVAVQQAAGMNSQGNGTFVAFPISRG